MNRDMDQRYSLNFSLYSDLTELCLCGNTIESWGPFITKFIPIECNAQKTTIPVWIKADRDIRILFTRTECEDDGVLGIHIGGNDNTLINVHSLGADKEWSACEQDILRPTKIMKLVIEWLPNGLFSVYSSLNPYGPLIQIDDMPSLESIKFIAFSSASAALSYFVYDVDEQRVEKLVAEPKKKLLPIDAVVHPLLAQNNYPIGFSTLCKYLISTLCDRILLNSFSLFLSLPGILSVYRNDD